MSKRSLDHWLFLVQRLSALLLAPLVLVHLVLIVIAVRNGLSAEEILGRTRAHIAWGVFYSLFVIAAAIHAPIGLRNILIEWTSLGRPVATALCLAFAALLLVLGLRAVAGVSGWL